MKIKAPAKINLVLEVLGKYKPNPKYHEVRSIIQKVDFLYDTLYFKKIDQDVIEIENRGIAEDEDTIFTSINLLKKGTKYKKGVKIIVEKNIPLCAGLGGGSSNAAATLIGSNKLWLLGYKDLMEIGSKIGMDVNFFLMKKKIALATGRGDLVKEIAYSNKRKIPLILVTPKDEISSEEAYDLYDKSNYSTRKKQTRIKKMLEVIKEGSIEDIADNIHNDLEEPVINKYPIIEQIKKDTIKLGALNAIMSGSGPTVFGIFDSDRKADLAYNVIKNFENLRFHKKGKIEL